MLNARIQSLEGVLLTHEHNDHTAGIDDVRPFCFRQQIDMPIYCLRRVADDLRARFAYAFTDYPGVPRLDIRVVAPGDTIPFAGGRIELVDVQHGRLPILGFRWYDLAYLTDVKMLSARTLDALSGTRTAIISALHHTGTHSHLSLGQSLGYLAELGVERGVLFHLSHKMGRAADLEALLPAGVTVGFDGLQIEAENR